MAVVFINWYTGDHLTLVLCAMLLARLACSPTHLADECVALEALDGVCRPTEHPVATIAPGAASTEIVRALLLLTVALGCHVGLLKLAGELLCPTAFDKEYI